jgi:hypothetical protein
MYLYIIILSFSVARIKLLIINFKIVMEISKIELFYIYLTIKQVHIQPNMDYLCIYD